MDNRQFSATVSARVGSRRIRLELSPAPLYGGPEGFYRVRLDRRWYDTADGRVLFMSADDVTAFLGRAVFDGAPSLPPAPVIPVGSRVTARLWNDTEPEFLGTWTLSPPILAHDGVWKVLVRTIDRGSVFVPCGDIKVRERHGDS